MKIKFLFVAMLFTVFYCLSTELVSNDTEDPLLDIISGGDKDRGKSYTANHDYYEGTQHLESNTFGYHAHHHYNMWGD